jgi:hypothetical protein
VGSPSTSLSWPNPRVTHLLPAEQYAYHPGAGTLTIDDGLPEGCVEALQQLWRSLPTAPKDKPSPIDRAYYADPDGTLGRLVDSAIEAAGLRVDRPGGEGCGTLPLLRFLHYPRAGGSLPAHVDLPRMTPSGTRTTHSVLLYLTDCERGGETLLLEARGGDSKLATNGGVAPGERATLARSAPRRGRLLLMPHACPHAAAPVESAPKTLIRGEVRLCG